MIVHVDLDQVFCSKILEQEGIIVEGKDHRLNIVNKMNQHPYESIIFMYMISNDNKACIGTAFQINERFALTAAHNLWDKENDKPMKVVRLFPSVSGILSIDKKHPNQIQVHSFKIPDQYIKRVKELKLKFHKNLSDINPFDFALIQLSKSLVRKEYLTIGCDYLDYKERKFEVAGYPGDVATKDRHKLNINPKIGQGYVDHIEDGVIDHLIDTTAGQSGSPLMIKNNGKYFVIGIHFFFIASKQNKIRMNYAIELSKLRIEQIYNWMKEMSQPEFKFYKIDSDGFKSYYVEDIAKEYHNEVALKDMKENQFQFNWNLPKEQRNIFSFRGTSVQKVRTFHQTSYQYIFSFQSLPKDESFTISGKIINLEHTGAIWFGIVTKKMKSFIENKQIALNDPHSLGVIGVLFDDKQNSLGFRNKKAEVLDNSIGCIVLMFDAFQQCLFVLSGEKVLYKFSVEKNIFVDSYLSIMLKEEGDCIKIN